MANAYGRSSSPQSVLDSANRAIKLEPNLAEGYKARSTGHFLMGRFDQDIEDSYWAIKLFPKFPAALNNLGESLWEVGRLDEAAQVQKRLIDEHFGDINYRQEAIRRYLRTLTDLGLYDAVDLILDRTMTALRPQVGPCGLPLGRGGTRVPTSTGSE